MINSAFPTKKILEENLSDYLCQARESLGLSLERLAEDLSVSKKYLIALENGDFKTLPPEVYALGLLKRYCKLLNIDEEKAIYLFKKKRIKKNISFFARPVIYKNFFDRFLTYRNFVFFLIFVLLFLLIFYLVKTLYPLYTNPYFKLENPDLCQMTVSEEKIEIAGFVKAEEKIWINGEEINPDKDGRFVSSIFLKKGENRIQFKIINKFGRIKEESCPIKRS